MGWKFLVMIVTIIFASVCGGYYQGGADEAVRCFLISVCGTGLGYCAGLLLKGKS